MNVKNGSVVAGRVLELFRHDADPAWGYTEAHEFSFGLYHPKNEVPGKKYPLHFALHCAGCSYFDSVTSILNADNLDTLKGASDEVFTLCLDDLFCPPVDYWWGGQNPQDNDMPSHWGTEPQPVEKRCLATLKWVMDNYPIDENMVYALGVSMGGSGVLGMALCRGDIFAAIKVCVPAGVRHVSERCSFGKDGDAIPDPPPVIEISAQNDAWSKGHGDLYAGMKEKRYALTSYWGNFGHDASNSRMPKINDLINTFDIYSIKKNEAYPVFLSASCDDRIPWLDESAMDSAGQMNAFFRWKNVTDTEDRFEMELYIPSEEELETSFTIPAEATAEVCLRRMQNMKIAEGETFRYTFGEISGEGKVVGGVPELGKLTLTREHKTLTILK